MINDLFTESNSVYLTTIRKSADVTSIYALGTHPL